MKKIIIQKISTLLVVLALLFTNNSYSQICLTAINGQWPTGTVTPVCGGVVTTIVANAFAGEYSIIALTAGQTYRFASSNVNDLLTIANNAGTIGYTYAIGTVTFRPLTTASYRVYRHNAACGSDAISRTITYQCGFTPAGCITALNGLWPTATYTPLCTGVAETITAIGYASEYSNVNLIAGTNYTFTSSVTTDVITITNAAGTYPFAVGLGTGTVFKPSVSGTYRFFTHLAVPACGAASVNRSRIVTCTGAVVYNPCTTIPVIAACATNVTTTFAASAGAWNPIVGSANPSTFENWYACPGQEKLYSFTPTITGMYQLNMVTHPATTFTDFGFKPVASGGCANNNWTFINDMFGVGTSVPFGPLTAGTAYYILIDEEATVAQTIVWNLICPSSAPANDEPCAIGNLTVGATCVTTAATNTAATNTAIAGLPAISCGYLPQYDVWYKFVATSTSTNIETYAGTNNDMVMQVLTLSGACPGGTWTEVACDDDGGPGFMSGLSDNAGGGFTTAPLATTIGTTYYIRMLGWNGSLGTFSICVYNAAVAPDPCLSILPITCGTPTTLVMTTGSGQSAYNNTCFGVGAPGSEKVYSFTAANTGNYQFFVNSQTGAFDNIHFLYKTQAAGCGPTGWTCIDWLAGAPIGSQTFSLTAGVGYYFLVDRGNVYGSTLPITENFTLICASGPLVCPANLGTGYSAITVPYLQAGLSTVGAVNDITATNTNVTCGIGTLTDGSDNVYSFTVGANANWNFQFTNAGSLTAQMTIYAGCPLSGNVSTCMGSAYTTGAGNLNVNNVPLVTGVTYYVVIDSWATYNATIPSYTLNIYLTPSPPVNDNCAGAIALVPNAAAVAGSSLLATQSLAPSLCSGFTSPSALDVWYSFTGNGGTMTVTGFSGAFDAVVQVYSATGPCAGLVSVGCIDATLTGGSEVFKFCSVSGTQYYTRIYGYNGGTGAFTMQLTTSGAPPVNDNCTAATGISAGATCTNTVGTLLGATNCGSIAGCTGTNNDDVWYSFVATNAFPTVTVSPSKGLDVVVQILSGACGAQSNVICTNATSFGQTEYATPGAALTLGNTYYVRVYDFFGGTAPTKGFVICVTNPSIPGLAPANDACANAVNLNPALSCTATPGTTVDATQQFAANATCSGFTLGNADDDVWYKFTATAAAHQISVAGADPLDPVVEIYSGGCGALTSLVCEDASAFPYTPGTENVAYGAFVSGTVYYIRVYGYGSLTNTSGTFGICVTDPSGTPPANDNCPGTALTVNAGPTCTITTAGTDLYAFPSVGTPAPCSGTADDDVWYSFVASQTKHDVVVTPSAGFDPVIQVFTGACGSLTSIACVNIGGVGVTETLNLINLVNGTTYRVRVFDAGGLPPATPTFTVCVNSPVIAPAPTNDACAGALTLGVGASCTPIAGTVESATASGVATVCAGTPDDDVWYKFVATAPNNIVQLQGSAQFDGVLQVYSGVCGAGVSIGCSNSSGLGGTETISTTCLTPGQTYYVRVYDFFTGEPVTPTFNICVYENPIVQPLNDDCSNALTVTCGSIELGSTVNAGGCGLPGACGVGNGGTPSPGVWYKYTGIGGEYVEFSTCTGTTYDTKLHAYTGTCGSLTCIASNDDVAGCGGGFQSRIGFLATAGTTYYVLVNGFNGATGPFTLSVVCYTCTVSTNGGQTSTSNAVPVVNDAVTVTLTGQTGSILQWEASFDNFVTAPIVLGNAGNNNLTIIMNANVPFIYFRALVQNNPACLTQYSTVVLHKMVCAPAIATSCDVFGDYVGNVTFNTINNTSTYSAGGDMYQDFTGISTNVVAGTSYSLSVTPGQPLYAYARMVWIDANGNGDFNDPGENVMLANAVTGTTTTTVTVPCTALGDIKMRVIIADNGFNTQVANADACLNPGLIGYNYGEVEEYTLSVAAGANLTVNPTGSVCQPNPTVVLTASGGNAGTYVWTPALGIISSTCAGATCAITVANTGISFYTVTGTVTASGCPGSVEVPVTTVPVAGVIAPTPAGTILCPSGLFSTKTLTCTGGSGSPLQWQESFDGVTWTSIGCPGACATGTTYLTSPSLVNKYYRCVSESPLCYDISSNTILLEVSTTPVITIGTKTATTIQTLWTPGGSGNYNVSWNGAGGSGAVTGVTSPYTITGLSAGLQINITVSQASPGANCFPASATVTNVSTLCAPPAAPTFGTITNTTMVVNNIPASGTYEVFYKVIGVSPNYLSSGCLPLGTTSYTITTPYTGSGLSVYMVACGCAGGYGQPGPAVVQYLQQVPANPCGNIPTFTLASNCANQINVTISGNAPANTYRIGFRRLTPFPTNIITYPMTGTVLNYTVANTALPQVWEVFAVSSCGAGGSLPYSNATQMQQIVIKGGCPAVQNLILSGVTCHGFTATWNPALCGIAPSTYAPLGYQLFTKAGTGNWNSYGSLTNIKSGYIWNSGSVIQVYVRANSCNGSFGPASTIQTVTLLSGVGCREEDQQSEEGMFDEGVTTENGTLSVYPNPNQGEFALDLQMSDITSQDVRIEVMNMLGQNVLTQITSINDGHLTEGVSLPADITSGNYMIRVYVGDNKAEFNTKINISK